MFLTPAICFLGHREIVDAENKDVFLHSVLLDEEHQQLYKPCKLLMECSVCPGCIATKERAERERCAK